MRLDQALPLAGRILVVTHPFQVTTGAEIATSTTQDDATHAGIIAHGGHHVAQARAHAAVHRVAPRRAVQHNLGHAFVQFVQNSVVHAASLAKCLKKTGGEQAYSGCMPAALILSRQATNCWRI